jgi:DNA processing protein
VVAGGFDRPYPARHQVLWREVLERGALVSEWPLGTRSEGWRFPARNRIIAGLAEAVVVVESRETGGSMITADAALTRGIPVLAMPGSIRNPAAAGTNRLIREGATPMCGVDDVFDLLSLAPPGTAPPVRPAPSPASAAVLAVVGWEPTPVGSLLTRTGLGLDALMVQLAHLELDGWVAGGGGWWQRT